MLRGFFIYACRNGHLFASENHIVWQNSLISDNLCLTCMWRRAAICDKQAFIIGSFVLVDTYPVDWHDNNDGRRRRKRICWIQFYNRRFWVFGGHISGAHGIMTKTLTEQIMKRLFLFVLFLNIVGIVPAQRLYPLLRTAVNKHVDKYTYMHEMVEQHDIILPCREKRHLRKNLRRLCDWAIEDGFVFDSQNDTILVIL